MRIRKLSHPYVIVFRTHGWSSYFIFGTDGDINKHRISIWSRANKLIPKDIKALKGNEKVVRIEVYKQVEEWTDEE